MLAASPALLLQTGAGTAPECPWGGFAALALCQGTPREPGAAWQRSWCCGDGHGQRGEGRGGCCWRSAGSVLPLREQKAQQGQGASRGMPEQLPWGVCLWEQCWSLSTGRPWH